ncbi:hypothetical protein [uncultured Bartonella sp.]|uniref:hypothetical protein n=1 Tax=uncultured Bartonella sp. TaxID=104108 RepID=UPI0025E97D9F|nr:hypothetical protein [uncultured Bartonella sp.]
MLTSGKKLEAAVIADVPVVTMSKLKRTFKIVYYVTISDFVCTERMEKARFLRKSRVIAASEAG